LGYWASFSTITEAAQIIRATFFHADVNVLTLAQNGLGYILGDFFTN
jgi:hypothetical protein